MKITVAQLEDYLDRLQSDSEVTKREAAAEYVASIEPSEQDRKIAEELGFKSTAKVHSPKASQEKWDEALEASKGFIAAKRKKNQRIILGAFASAVAIGTAVATGGFGPTAISGLIGTIRTILGAVKADEAGEDFTDAE